tara:strand:+ start:1176 stop:2300 length:1125 start_codon:yes stop_codon:yes gene_type:complete
LKLSNNDSLENKRKIKNIGFICTSLDNVAGGLERQIVRTCNSLAEYNLNIFLISYDNKNAKSFYEISSKVKWIKCGNGLEPHKGASLIKRLRQIIFLRKKLMNYNITNLVTFHHGLFPRSFIATLFLDIRRIVSERNSLELYKYIKLRKFNLGFISMIFADFITIQLEGYRSQYPFFLKNKITVIPNIIKTSLDKNLKPNFDSNIISMVGRLSEQKNFEPILYQASIQKKAGENYKINIAGDGPLRRYFENKYNKLIINSYLELSGNVKNIDTFLSKASIFCLPSLWEGYPNSLVEALRIGMPIITTQRMANLKEFIEDDINGYIVDDEDLLRASLELLKDKDKLKIMSANSKNKFIKLTDNKPLDKWKQILEF